MIGNLESGECPEEGRPGSWGCGSAGSLDGFRLRELERLRVANGALFDEMLSAFQYEACRRIAAMKAGLEARDGAVLRQEGHGLQGTAGIVGALRLADLCHDLQIRAASRNFSECASLLDEMETEKTRVLEALHRRFG